MSLAPTFIIEPLFFDGKKALLAVSVSVPHYHLPHQKMHAYPS